MIFVTGANGWLGLNLINAIVSGKTTKWGLEKDDIQALILNGTSKEKLRKLPRDLAKNVAKLLMYMVAISVMLICWLSLLMPVVVLYVVVLPLVLNHFVLIRLRTRRSQAATK